MAINNDFEIQKFEFEKYRVEEEIKLRKKEVELKEKELQLKQRESEKTTKKSFGVQLISPVGIAVVVALIGLIGTVINGVVNSNQSQKKQQSDLIIKMSEISDEKQRASNLLFFEKGGFISLSKDYTKYLRDIAGLKENDNIPPPSITSLGDTTLITKFEGVYLKPYRDFNGVMVIGSGHVVKQDELNTGLISIGGKLVKYTNGITDEQSNLLLNQDLNDLGKRLDSLVKVKLNINQHDALISFVWNISIDSFKTSSVLKLINENKLNEVPNEMIKWGRQSIGLRNRRKQEIELWKKPDF